MKMEWQPIDSAPKEGGVILLWGKNNRIADGSFSKFSNTWIWPYVYVEPTHWMPLPKPPKE